MEWSYQTDGGVESSPAIGIGGIVYIGSRDGRIYALDPNAQNPNDRVIWSFQTGGSIVSSPAIGADGTIYIGNSNRNNSGFYAFNPDGSLKWEYSELNEIYSSPVIDTNGLIYIGSKGGNDRNNFYAFDPNGNIAWSFSIGDDITSSPAIGVGGIVYIGSHDGGLYALDPDPNSDNKVQWRFQTGDTITSSPAIDADGTIYIGNDGGKLYALNPDPNSDSAVKWSFQTGDTIASSPAITTDGMIVLGCNDGQIYALDSGKGTLEWSYQTGAEVESTPAIGADGTIYIGSADGRVYALDPNGQVKWSYHTSGSVDSSPAIGQDGTIYIGSDDGMVYALGKDITPPEITCPDIPVEATGDATPVTYAAVVTDAVDPAPHIVYNPVPGSNFSLGFTPVTVTATDFSDNVSTHSFTINVVDTTPPAITCPNMVVEATGPQTPVTYTAVVTDAVDSNPNIVYNPVPGSNFPLGVTEVMVTAKDSSGNVRTHAFTVTVRDTTPPAITCPNMTVEAMGWFTKVNYAADVTDAVDSDPNIVYDPEPGSNFPVGTTSKVTVTAKDSSGNVRTHTFTITVQDSTPPVIICPNMTVEATGPQTPVTYPAVATDIVDLYPGIGYNPVSVSNFSVGTTQEVMVTATDFSKNSSTSTFTVTVVDTTPPAIICPDMIIEATGPQTPVTYTAVVTDAVDSNPDIVYDPILPGSNFPLGVTDVTVTATDFSGNVRTHTFTVTVRDTTHPVITCPNMTVEATGQQTPVTYTSVVTDAVDPNPEIVYDPILPGSNFPLGVTEVTVTAKDFSDNVSTHSFTVNVVDTTPPAITCPNMTVEATGPQTPVTYTAVVTDAVDSNPNIVYNPVPGSNFPLGVTEVMVTAKDSSGNVRTHAFTVTVRDTTPPAITCPNMTVEAMGWFTKVNYAADVTDAVDPASHIVYDPEPGSNFPLGTTSKVTVTAKDFSGNVRTHTFTVTVQDSTPPVIICPNITVEATGPQTPVIYPAVATDIADPYPGIGYNPVSVSNFSVGTTQNVMVTATDFSKNSSTSTFTVTVVDTTPPAIICPNMIIEATGPQTPVNYAAEVTDAVDPAPHIVYNPVPGSNFSLGVTEVTVTATDYSGNVRTHTFMVTVHDTTPPAITCPDMTVEATGPQTPVTYTAVVTDAVDPAPHIVYDPLPGSNFPLGVTEVTVTVTDYSGNVSTHSFTVTVQDTTPPKVSQKFIPPDDMIVVANKDDHARVTYTAVFTDAVDFNPGIVYNPLPGSNLPLGITNVLITATDFSGNSSDLSFTVFVGTGLAKSAWPCRGHDARHTGLSQYRGSQSHSLKWSHKIGNSVDSSVAIGTDGTIYIGGDNHKLYALNPEDGSEKWSYEAYGEIHSSPAIGVDGTIYVGSYDGMLYAINPKDGRKRWSSPSEKDGDEDDIFSSPAIGADGTIYVGTENGKLYAIEPNHGLKKWVAPVSGSISSSPAIGSDGTIYVGSSDSKVYAFRPKDGSEKWSCMTGSEIISSPAIDANDTIYIGSSDNTLYALNAKDGTEKWSCTMSDDIDSSPAIGKDGTIYVGSDDGKLYALDSTLDPDIRDPNIRAKWKYLTGGKIWSSPAIDAAGTVYVGSNDGCIYALGPNGTLQWQDITHGEVYSSPAIGADGTVYIGSSDGMLYAIGSDGAVQNPDPNSPPNDDPDSPDNPQPPENSDSSGGGGCFITSIHLPSW